MKFILPLAACVALAAAVVPSAQGAPHGATHRIAIRDFAFHARRIVVAPGTKLVWTNDDSDPHTISSHAAHWSSEALDTGQSFTRVVRRRGTYHYVCTIHPFMHGTVVVR
jgi:plastocyanin